MSIRRNGTYNLIRLFIPLAVSLGTVPVYLGLTGARFKRLASFWAKP